MEKISVQLNLNLINAVLKYLGTRPYQEVYPIVQEIQNAVIPQLPVPEANTEKEISNV